MNIIAYQYNEDNVFRFIYLRPSGRHEVVSVDNYKGMYMFLKDSGAQQISDDIDIYQYCKDLEVAV